MVLGLALWILAYALSQATVSDARLPAMFLPAAIGVGLLLRLPTGQWWAFLTSIALVDIIGGTLTGIAAPAVAVTWGVSNVSQTLLLAIVLRWAGVDMTRARDPVVLGVSAGIIVALVSVTGSLALSRVSDVNAQQFWADWWGSDVLSIVLVVPVVLLMGRAAPPRGRMAEATAWLAVTSVAVGLAFSEKVSPVFPVWLWLILGGTTDRALRDSLRTPGDVHIPAVIGLHRCFPDSRGPGPLPAVGVLR